MKAVGSTQYTVETLRRISSPDRFAADLQRLPQAAREFPLSADWTVVAAESLYAPGSLRLIQLREHEQVAALAALAVAQIGRAHV